MTRQELPPDILPSEIKEEDMPAHIAMLINKLNRESYHLNNRINGMEEEITTAAEINKEKFKKNDEEHGQFQFKDAEILKVFNEVVGLLKKIEQSVEKLEPERVITFMDTMQPALKERKDWDGFWNIVKKYKGTIGAFFAGIFIFMAWFWASFHVAIIEGMKAWVKSIFGI